MPQSQLTRRVFSGTLASALLAGVAARAQQGATPPQNFVLLTGASGGAFSEYGPLLARIAAAHAGIELDVQPTGGSNDNIRAVSRGDADLGLINMGPAFDAWNGRPPFATGGPYRNLRALFPMYETPFSLVAMKASGIGRVADLAGRTVGVGPAGGPRQVFFAGLSKELGLDTKVATGSPSELARRLLAGEIDAFWYGSGVPVAAFVEVLEGGEAVVFGLSDQEVAALRRAFAYFAPYEIPAGSYKGQAAPLGTAAVWNFVVASERLPEEAAYGLTRAALEHTAEMQAELPAASGTAAQNVSSDTFLPLHAGAVRYYREKGIKLPPVLAPA